MYCAMRLGARLDPAAGAQASMPAANGRDSSSRRPAPVSVVPVARLQRLFQLGMHLSPGLDRAAGSWLAGAAGCWVGQQAQLDSQVADC